MDIQYIVQALTIAGIVGLVKWVWGINASLQQLRLKVAEEYHDKADLREVVVVPILRELERVTRSIEKLQDKEENRKVPR